MNFTQFVEPIPVVARSKVWVYGRSLCRNCGFVSHRGHGCLSVVYVVCCQVEVSVTGCSLFLRSSTAVVCLCMIEEPHRGRLCTLGQSNHEKRTVEFRGHSTIAV